MPAPEVRAVGTIAAGTLGIEPGIPAGTEAGDLLVAGFESGGPEVEQEATNALVAGGWTAAPKSGQVAGNTRLTVLYKIATGSDVFITNDTGNHQMGRIIGIKKGTFNAANPFNASAGGTQAKTKSVSIPGATTTVAECLILAFASGNLPDAGTTTEFGAATNASLTGITERIDNTSAQGDGGALYLTTGVKATAGAYNATTCTAVTEAERGVISLAIAPPGNALTLGLSDSISLSDSLGKGTTKTQSDSLALSDQVAKTAAHAQADSLALSDAVAKAASRVQADTLPLSDAIAKTPGVGLADSVGFSDQLVKAAEHVVSDALPLSDALAKAVEREESDSLPLSDAVAKSSSHAQADSVALSDAIAKSAEHVEADTITLSDSIGKQVGKALSDAVSLADSFAKSAVKFVADLLGLSDSAKVTTGKPASPAHLELSARAATSLSLDARAKTNAALTARPKTTLTLEARA